MRQKVHTTMRSSVGVRGEDPSAAGEKHESKRQKTCRFLLNYEQKMLDAAVAEMRKDGKRVSWVTLVSHFPGQNVDFLQHWAKLPGRMQERKRLVQTPEFAASRQHTLQRELDKTLEQLRECSRAQAREVRARRSAEQAQMASEDWRSRAMATFGELTHGLGEFQQRLEASQRSKDDMTKQYAALVSRCVSDEDTFRRMLQRSQRPKDEEIQHLMSSTDLWMLTSKPKRRSTKRNGNGCKRGSKINKTS